MENQEKQALLHTLMKLTRFRMISHPHIIISDGVLKLGPIDPFLSISNKFSIQQIVQSQQRHQVRHYIQDLNQDVRKHSNKHCSSCVVLVTKIMLCDFPGIRIFAFYGIFQTDKIAVCWSECDIGEVITDSQRGDQERHPLVLKLNFRNFTFKRILEQIKITQTSNTPHGLSPLQLIVSHLTFRELGNLVRELLRSDKLYTCK